MRLLTFSVFAFLLSLSQNLEAFQKFNPDKRFDYITIENGLSQNTVNAILKDSEGYMWFGTNDGLNRYDGYSIKIYRNHPDDTTSLSNSKIYAIAEDSEGNIWIGTVNGLNMYNKATDSFVRYYSSQSNPNSLSNNFVRCLFADDDGMIYIGTLGGGLTIHDPSSGLFTRSKNRIDQASGKTLQIDNISSIIKDKNNHILIGAEVNAMVYYNAQTDGFQAKTFDNNPLTKTAQNGRTLYEDRSGDIWICTEGDGLYRWHNDTESFSHYFRRPNANGLSGEIIKGILEVDENQMWVAIDGGGLNILDKNTGQVKVYNYNPHNTKGINSNALYTIYGDNQDLIWIGTFDGGVNLLNPQKKDFIHYTQNSDPNALSHKAVLCFLEETDDLIWIGTDGGGLNRFDKISETFTAFRNNQNGGPLSSNVITSLYKDSNNQLWIGTYQGGIMKYEGKKGFRIFNAEMNIGLENNNVWNMLEDQEGNFWIGTLGGLYIFDRTTEKFQRIQNPENKSATNLIRNICLMQDHKNNIWIGGNGISVYTPSTKKWSYYNHSQMDSTSLGVDNVRSIFQDSKRNIWIGTEGAGINLFYPKTRTFSKWTTNDGLPNNSVHQILEDDSGNLWISTNKGISKINFENGHLVEINNYDVSDGLQSNQFSYSAALKASSGEMYFGGVNGFNVFLPDNISINKYEPPVKITGFKINEKEVIPGNDSPLSNHISVTKEITLNHSQSRVFSIEFTAISFTSSSKNQYAYLLEGFNEEDHWLYVGNKRSATYTNLNSGEYIFKVKAANNDGIWNNEPAILKINVLPPIWKTWYAYSIYTAILAALIISMRRFTIERIHLKNDIKLKELEKQKNEELNLAKLQFFTSISHEFKTPLTLIIGPLRKLMDDFKGDQEVQFYHSLMYRNAKRLLHLINQLMDFRKIENGKQKISVEKRDIVSFLLNIKSAFENLAVEKKINLGFESEHTELPILFDQDILDKVFYNLLANAFKFTPERGNISMGLKIRDDNYLELTVEDSGIGIPKEVIPLVFDRFYHLDTQSKPQSSNSEGSGIGLALSYELIKLHHGMLEVESEAGKGSKFTVKLPLDEKVYKAEILNQQSSGIKNQVEDYIESNYFDYGKSLDWVIPGQDSKKPILLLVEDNLELRLFMNQFLKANYRILNADNGSEGIIKARKFIPDLIVSDIMMPKMDGIEMCTILKNDKFTNHIPIILLTAKSSEENKIEGLNTGADDYIYKPFHTKILELKIRNLITQRAELQKKYSDRIFNISSEKLPSQDEIFLNKVKSIIEKNLADPGFDVNVFAREINMSRSVLYRKFRAVTGQSVNEMISIVRLKKAAHLLGNQSLSVSDVAYTVGYSDPQYFSKCFRKKYKCTPTEYAAKKNMIS